jgi:hypothetical protein
MKIELIDPPRIVADGWLTGVVVSEQATPFPYIVLQMRLKGASEDGLPVEVTLGEIALSTIVRAVKESKVERIRDLLR